MEETMTGLYQTLMAGILAAVVSCQEKVGGECREASDCLDVCVQISCRESLGKERVGCLEDQTEKCMQGISNGKIQCKMYCSPGDEGQCDGGCEYQR